MPVTRRGFVTGGSLVGLGLAAGLGRSEAQEGVREAVLKLSSQEGIIPGDSLRAKVERMAEWGFQGLELWGGGLPNRVDDVRDAIAGTGVEVSAICAGYEGCVISHDESERRKAVESIKVLLAAAGELQSTGLIVVPAFHGQTQLSNQDARPILVELLKDVGAHAEQCGTRVLLEPLNRGECFFLRQLADAAAICRDVDSPGVGMMGDFYHMNIEETSDLGAFLSAGKYLHHVHLASRRRVLPGQDERSFIDGFRGLKMIGYQDFCSFECGVDGDPMAEIPKAVSFLRDQWAQA